MVRFYYVSPKAISFLLGQLVHVRDILKLVTASLRGEESEMLRA
jgi:hypothetical protein